MQAFEILRDRVNRDLPPEQAKQDSAIVEMLWDRFGHDPDTLDNLALEFLAQGTDRLRDAVAAMTFEDPASEIADRLGIGRTKSFAALSAAMGANDDGARRVLDELQVSSADPDDRLYVYLTNRPQHRFIAVAHVDWPNDTDLLAEIIESDPAVMDVVMAGIDHRSFTSRLIDAIGAWFGSAADQDQTLAERLAQNQDLIQMALAEKDWSKSPRQAARLLRLNPFEARALVAAEINHAPVTATKLLWDTYHPQYHVWIPFGVVGILATIALAIFGRMAKRWADMNA